MLSRSMNFCIRVYPHNDLGNLAHYHIEIIKSKLESGDHEGIALDCTSAVIAMAFYVEAVINYVGLKKLKQEWPEMANFAKKVTLLRKEIGFAYDKKVEPFSTVEMLKSARNNLAHGKPLEFTKTVNSSRDLSRSMQPNWSSLVSDPEIVLKAFQDVRGFKDILFKQAGIKPGATFTSAIGGG